MAVWNADTQKLDLVKSLYTIHSCALDQTFGPVLSPYLNPEPTLTKLNNDSTWDDLAIVLAWDEPDDESDNAKYWEENIGGIPAKFVGTPAIYRLLHYVRLGRFRCKDQYDYDKIRQTMDTFGKLLCGSTQISPKEFLRRYGQRQSEAYKIAKLFENFAECIKRLRTAYYNDDPRKLDSWHYFGSIEQDFTIHKIGELLIFHGTQELTNQCLIFGRKHLDQLVGTAMRLANTYDYLSLTHNDSDLSNSIPIVDWTIEVAAKISPKASYKVARAFHKARAFIQMSILKNTLQESMEHELQEYRAEGLDTIVRISEFLGKLQAFSVPKKVELLHIYKWMPSPDFDATRAFAECKAMHDNPRDSGADPNANDRQRNLWNIIKEDRKLHLAYAYHRMTNRWPPNLEVRGSAPSIADVKDWDYRGILPYHQLGKDIVGQIKDKKTVSPVFSIEEMQTTRNTDSSYLLWYMENAGQIDTKTLLKQYPDIEEDNYARVAYKAESHKPDSRLFFMAPPKTRTLLGEFEGNLSRISSFYPGSLQGKNTRDKAKILLDIMDPYAALRNVTIDEMVTNHIVQFDLTKFSSKSNYNVTRDYHRFWADVFAEPSIEDLAEIGCKSRILHTTCGLTMSYQNKGADLEGFRGRMMTMFHADLLGAACRLAREEKVISGLSKLAVFIDDGVCKVAIIGEHANAVKNTKRFVEILEEVYSAAGQDANLTKTVVSPVGGEMLAEFYYQCTKMPTGLKAAQRLYPDYENAACGITEEFDQLFSTSQGSVKDGADWLATHYRYVESCIKAVFRWCRKEFNLYDPYRLALKLMTPKSYGGLGMNSLQGLVTTAVVNQTSEGLSMLNRAGRYVREARNDIQSILMMPVIQRDPLSVLRDPLRIRADTKVLIENRVTMKVVKWLESNPGQFGAFIGEYRSESLTEHATKVAEALLAGSSISYPVMLRAWKCTPLSHVETIVQKFKRSATIINFLGRAALTEIRKKNAADLHAVLEMTY